MVIWKHLNSSNCVLNNLILFLITTALHFVDILAGCADILELGFLNDSIIIKKFEELVESLNELFPRLLWVCLKVYVKLKIVVYRIVL